MRSCFERLKREKRSFLAKFGGACDFFAPVMSKGRCEGYLVSGPVLEKCPEPGELRALWKKVSGKEASDLDPDFLHYSRVLLALPVLDRRGLEGYRRLLDLLALWLYGDVKASDSREINRLRIEVFSKQVQHPYWVDWAVGLDKFFAKPEKGYELPGWTKEELGITRIPTVAVALMPRKGQAPAGTLEGLCHARGFQHECFRACREFPETLSKALGNYGAVVLTSTKPGLSPVQARLEVRERVQALCRRLGRLLQAEILAGIGSFSTGGERLDRSYREAVSSLHQAVQTGKGIVHSDPSADLPVNPSANQMRPLFQALSEAVSRSSPERLALARERFIGQLMYTGHGLDVSRAYLSSALHVLLERFEKRLELEPSAAQRLGADLMARLDISATLPELMTAFGGALDALVRYQDKPREAGSSARVEKVKAEIDRDPSRSWRLKELSKRAALSPPTFLKWFRKIAGLSFGPYLRKARLNKAKDLLREGHLTLERVAQECGFSSASSFVQIFRRAHGTSPRRYRRKG